MPRPYSRALPPLARARARTPSAAAAAAAPPLPAGCSADLLSRFDAAHLDSLPNAYVMALLASDAYPTSLLGGEGATNAKYDVTRYEAALRARWTALGARSVDVVDDDASRLEAHAVVVASGSDVFVAFRGTSTTEGWTNNARMSPWKLVGGSGEELSVS